MSQLYFYISSFLTFSYRGIFALFSSIHRLLVLIRLLFQTLFLGAFLYGLWLLYSSGIISNIFELLAYQRYCSIYTPYGNIVRTLEPSFCHNKK